MNVGVRIVGQYLSVALDATCLSLNRVSETYCLGDTQEAM